MPKYFDSLQEMTLGYTEFVDMGIEIFDSEQLTDTILKTFLAMMCDGWSTVNVTSLDQFARIYQEGLWLPCMPRVALMGQIDNANDGYPDYTAVPLLFEPRPRFLTASRISKLPKGWSAVPGYNALYSISYLLRDPQRDRAAERKNMKEPLTVWGWYLSVHKDKILPCLGQGQPSLLISQWTAYWGGPLLSVVSDMKNYWNVQTDEDVISGDDRKIKTPIRLGVTGEMVKSLFYARSLPVTESGRKRPILHWVRAHQRRLRDGIDIDIDKHLRGIDRFNMDGFDFDITRPRKRNAPLIAA